MTVLGLLLRGCCCIGHVAMYLGDGWKERGDLVRPRTKSGLERRGPTSHHMAECPYMGGRLSDPSTRYYDAHGTTTTTRMHGNHFRCQPDSLSRSPFLMPDCLRSPSLF
jgi:hypothetical protein